MMDWFVCKNLVFDRDFLESLAIGGGNNEMEGKGPLAANQSSKLRSSGQEEKKNNSGLSEFFKMQFFRFVV
jgi:hypothetical protein